MVDKKADLKILVKNIIATLIGLVILFVFRAIVVNLSAMDTELFSKYDITIATIFSVVMLSLVGVLIFRFYKQSKPIIGRLFPEFEGASDLFENIMYIFIILIGYFALKGVVHPFLDEVDYGWIYQLIFVALAVYPVYKISTVAIDSSDDIVDLLFSDEEEKTISDKEKEIPEGMVVCPSCGNVVAEDKFCTECGADLSSIIEEQDESEKDNEQQNEELKCSECGAEIDEEDSFCVNCGAQLD